MRTNTLDKTTQVDLSCITSWAVHTHHHTHTHTHHHTTGILRLFWPVFDLGSLKWLLLSLKHNTWSSDIKI